MSTAAPCPPPDNDTDNDNNGNVLHLLQPPADLQGGGEGAMPGGGAQVLPYVWDSKGISKLPKIQLILLYKIN